MRKKKHRKACHFITPLTTHYRKYGSTIIPVEIITLEDHSYHMVISVKVNHLQGDMILDTGASVSVIDQKLLEGKETEALDVHLQSGSVTGQIENVKVVKIETFSIGDLHRKNIRLAVMDLDYVNEMYSRHLNRKIIGLLGSDFCVKHQVIIDYQKKILICRK